MSRIYFEYSWLPDFVSSTPLLVNCIQFAVWTVSSDSGRTCKVLTLPTKQLIWPRLIAKQLNC